MARYSRHSVKSLCIGMIGFISLSGAIGAQTPGSQSPEGQSGAARYEVGSVKVTAPGTFYTQWSRPGEFEFRAMNASLKGLLARAYNVTELQIAPLPSWTDKIHWDVVAKPSGTTALSEVDSRQALQALLQEHLHLKAHFEHKQVKGLRLVATPEARAKLIPSKGGTPGHTEFDDKGFRAHNITMDQLRSPLEIALQLANYESFVEDDTHISGNYDIRLNFAQKEDDTSSPSLFAALPKQLGLKLELAKVTAQMLVVDHIDQKPSE